MMELKKHIKRIEQKVDRILDILECRDSSTFKMSPETKVNSTIHSKASIVNSKSACVILASGRTDAKISNSSDR